MPQASDIQIPVPRVLGLIAALNGETVFACPYLTGNKHREAWLVGHQFADDLAESEKPTMKAHFVDAMAQIRRLAADEGMTDEQMLELTLNIRRG